MGDKVLLVTGGSRGIGAAAARLAAASGWAVAVNYTANSLAADEVVRAIRAAGGQAMAVQADVADEDQVLKMYQHIDAKLGRLTGLVNNAGVVDRAQRVEDMSAAARLGSPGEYVDYAAAKSAIDAFTIGLAKEVAADGIRVNAVRPGLIETEIHASGGRPDRVDALKHQVPMQRGGTAEEVAQAILWLLSDAASYTTMSLVDVSGAR